MEEPEPKPEPTDPKPDPEPGPKPELADTLDFKYSYQKEQTFYYHGGTPNVVIKYLTSDKDIAVKVLNENVVRVESSYPSDSYETFYFEIVGEGTTEVEFSTKDGKPIVAKITVPPTKSLTGLAFREKEATYELSDTSYKYVYWDYTPSDFNDPNLRKISLKTSDVETVSLSYGTGETSVSLDKSINIKRHKVGTATLTLTATMYDDTTLTDTMTVNVIGEEETPVATKSARMAKTATQEQEIIIFERGADE